MHFDVEKTNSASRVDVSVIIPIYNRKNTIYRSVGSAFAQVGIRVEVIVIDDASTDGTLDTLKALEANDQTGCLRVIALAQNMGQSHARNCGLHAATGDYIAMLDSDDAFAAPDVLQRWVQTARALQADIVVSETLSVQEHGPPKPHLSWPSNKTMLSGDLNTHPELVYARNCWQCLYDRAFLRDKNVRFSENLRQREDRLFLIQAFLASQKITMVNLHSHLHYYDQSNSTMKDKNPEQLEMFITHINELSESFQKARERHQNFATFEEINALIYVLNVGRYWRKTVIRCLNAKENRNIVRRYAEAITNLTGHLAPNLTVPHINKSQAFKADMIRQIMQEKKLWLLKRFLKKGSANIEDIISKLDPESDLTKALLHYHASVKGI